MGRIIDEDDVLAIIDKHYVLGQGLLNSTLDAIEEKIVQLPSPQTDASDTDGDMISRKLMHDLGATCIARRDDDGELIALGRIDMLPSAQPVDEGYLIDWYISSVDNSEPVWTEAHIEELMNDFYLIPKGVY